MKSDSLKSICKRIGKNLEEKPAAEQFRLGIYWGVVTLSILILGFSIHHVQNIPSEIRSEIKNALNKRPWTNDLVVVDGRDIYLRGTIEPNSGIEIEIAIISEIPGVQNVISMLEEEPKLSAHIAIQISQGQLLAEGQLNGDILEQTMQSLKGSFPDLIIRDRIRIDDRLGRPLWIEGLDSSLESLQDLKEFVRAGLFDQSGPGHQSIQIAGPRGPPGYPDNFKLGWHNDFRNGSLSADTGYCYQRRKTGIRRPSVK